MKETYLVHRTIHSIREQFPGSYVRKLADRFTRGIPDIMAIVCGVPFFIETKAKDGVLEPIQEQESKEIRLAGGVWMLARDTEDVLARIRTALEARKLL